MYRFLSIRPIRWVVDRWRKLSPSELFVASFASLVVVGTLGLLFLPGLYTGERLGFVDALFTATSVVCVTGLLVVDVGADFTFWGQAWILLLVQLGGLGLVTLSSLIIAVLGKRLSLRTEMLAGSSLGAREISSLVESATIFTFAAEGVGALLLWIAFTRELGPVEAIWPAVFHAVSAYCNAGISIFSGNLMGHADDPLVLLLLSALVILGGFGYLSTGELYRWWRCGGWSGGRRLSTHTRAALVTTLALLAIGFVLFGIFEWNGVLRSLGPADRIVNAWFLSVVPRTAGFYTIPYEEAGNATVYLTILLMVVGGSPGSTAGGIKTTTLAVLAALAWQRLRGRRNAVIHHRAIPEGTVERTIALALIAFALTTAAVFWLSYTETRGMELAQARAAFLPIFFEAVSAFSTAGLSMDATPAFSDAGKITLGVLMFVGRVGPLSFFAAITIKSRSTPRDVRPAREDVIVG